jgi:hypothetical protein
MDEKAELILRTDAKLDGHPAKIAGLKNDYASVWAMGSNWNLEATYSWEAVRRVMAGDCEFHTK